MSTNPKQFKEAQRAQVSMLSAVEKRTLIWLAERMPSWVNSDHLTSLGLISLIGAGLSYWYSRQNKLGLIMVIGFLVEVFITVRVAGFTNDDPWAVSVTALAETLRLRGAHVGL